MTFSEFLDPPICQNLPVVIRPAGRGGASPPPFWGQIKFLSVSFFRKLIVHENLYLKLFCSSKIVDFRALFAKFSAPQAYFTWVLPHIWNLAPPFFERYLRAWPCRGSRTKRATTTTTGTSGNPRGRATPRAAMATSAGEQHRRWSHSPESKNEERHSVLEDPTEKKKETQREEISRRITCHGRFMAVYDVQEELSIFINYVIFLFTDNTWMPIKDLDRQWDRLNTAVIMKFIIHPNYGDNS